MSKNINWLVYFILCIMILACENEINYYQDEDGLWIEDVNDVQSDSITNKYNFDNKIFVPEIEYIYDYYQIRNEEKLKISSGGWDYIDYNTPNSSTIMEYGIQTMKGHGFMTNIEDYTQSVIQFNMYDKEGETSFGKTQSGVIENAKNVWIHPLRYQNFKILELNPFPYIKSPYNIGNKYSWTLKIGDHWADPNWKVWSGVIKNEINYEIVGKTEVETKAGKFEVFVVDSEAESRIGKTRLKSYYNERVGFVKLEYQNIDSSKMVIELKEIRSK